MLNTVFSFFKLFNIFINDISVKYFKEINVGQEYEIKFNQKFNKLEIYVVNKEFHNMLCVNINFKFINIINTKINNDIFENKQSNNIPREQIINFKETVKLQLNEDLFKKMYPFLHKNFINYQIASIFIISRIVGMIVPGKYSLCNSFDLKFNNNKNINNTIDINIDTFNNDLSLIDINMKSDFHIGKINCM